MTPYKAIIFDLGKVVFDLSFDLVFQYWATASGKPLEEIKSKFLFDELFDQMERNEMTEAYFRITVSQRLGINITDQEFDKGWCNLYLDVYPELDNLLKNLKKNYRIIALTNTNIIHNRVWRIKYAEILLNFEKIFSSHEMETRKPEANAYQMVLDYLQCNAEETIFLDDNPDNIIGAKNLNIEAILVTSVTQMMNDLTKYGLLQNT